MIIPLHLCRGVAGANLWDVDQKCVCLGLSQGYNQHIGKYWKYHPTMIHGFVDVGGWATSLQNMKVNRILSSETGDSKPNNLWNQQRIWFIYSPNIFNAFLDNRIGSTHFGLHIRWVFLDGRVSHAVVGATTSKWAFYSPWRFRPLSLCKLADCQVRFPEGNFHGLV